MKVFLKIPKYLDNGGESDLVYIPIEAKIKEMTGITILCGGTLLDKLIPEFGNRKIVAWFNYKKKHITGMIDIQCNKEEADKIQSLMNGYSLRSNGESYRKNFWNFENE